MRLQRIESAISTLETQESCWCDLVQVQRPKNRESRWGKYQPKYGRKTDVSAQAGSQEKESVTSSFLDLFFYSGPQRPG